MKSLASHGWPAEAVAFLHGLNFEELRSTVGSIADEWELEDFQEVIHEAKKQRTKMDCEDRAYIRDPVSFQMDKTWVAGGGRADLSDSSGGVRIAQARALLPRAAWPNRLSRRMATATDDQQRMNLEEMERDRLSGELVVLLRKFGLIKLDEGKTPEKAQQWLLKRHAMGRRPNTLRQHVRLARKISYYMKGAYLQPWFRSSQDVMEYVSLRLEEPCGKSVPSSIWATLKFVETSAEVPESQKISSDLSLKNFFEEVARHPSWAIPKTRCSAQRIPLSIALAWEMVLMNDAEKNYVRIYAWFKLLKLWAALRWDDTMGIPPSSIDLVREKGMRGKIVRSKTTGDGKKIDVQEFFISFDAWLLAPQWLSCGWDLFVEMGNCYGNGGRDFLLPRPDRRLHGFRGAMVRYPDALAMSRALATDLKKVDVDGDAVSLDQLRNLIVIPDASGFWSEHSERVTMTSWAAALGVDPESRRRWGRWKPSTDEEYAKTSFTMVLAAQKLVAEKLRWSVGKADTVEDESVLHSLGKWLEGRGFTETEIDEQLKRLRHVKRDRRWRRGETLQLLDGSDEEEAGGMDTSPVASLDEVGLASPLALEDAEEAKPAVSEGLVDLEVGTLPISPGTFVLSVVGRSKRRTLHCVGSCYRRPGIHYKDFLVIGDNRPQLEAGERLCTSCFGKQDKLVAESAGDAGGLSDGQSGSSVSSSTSLGSQSSDSSG